MAKQKTPLGDILDYLDRVEGRDIHTLSIAKLRERVRERIPMEKNAMIKFAKAASVYDGSKIDDLFGVVFEANANTELPEDGEASNPDRMVPDGYGGTRKAYSDTDAGDQTFS